MEASRDLALSASRLRVAKRLPHNFCLEVQGFGTLRRQLGLKIEASRAINKTMKSPDRL